MWSVLFIALTSQASEIDDAWAARDGAALERLCRAEQSGEACFFFARTRKLALEQALADTGRAWVLAEPFEPFPQALQAQARQVAAAYAQIARIDRRSRYADDGLAMSAGLQVRTGNAGAGWRDAVRARTAGNGDAMGDEELSRFALYAVMERSPDAEVDPWSPVPLLRADAKTVAAVHALLDQAGLEPGWRELSLLALDRAEPDAAQELLERHRSLLDGHELGPLLARAWDAPLSDAPRRTDLARYRWHYARQRAAGAPASTCTSVRSRSASCLAEASVELYLDLDQGRYEAARGRLSEVQGHRWADRLELDLESARLVLEDLQRCTDRAAIERELRRLAASVDARRLLTAAGGMLPYDLDPDGLAARALDRAIRSARPEVLEAMLAGEFTTFGDFLRSPLGGRLAGGLDPNRAHASQLSLAPRWAGAPPAEAAHWTLLFDAIRAEGLALALKGGPGAYEAHVRKRAPGVLEGRLGRP